MQKHVFIAIPAYAGTVHLATFRSVVAAILALVQRGDKFTLFDDIGSAMIAHSRDLLLAHFLASEATHCLMIDHDVVFTPDAALRVVDAGVDFVGGVYPHRKDPLSFPIKYLDLPELWADPKTGLLKVAGIPGGFLCVSRECVIKMSEHYADKQFDDATAPKGYATALFENIHEGRTHYGEDISFCKRWTDMGGDVWIDPELYFGHIGNKTFHGCLGDQLRSMMNRNNQPRRASVA